jgi:hypothetical protein
MLSTMTARRGDPCGACALAALAACAFAGCVWQTRETVKRAAFGFDRPRAVALVIVEGDAKRDRDHALVPELLEAFRFRLRETGVVEIVGERRVASLPDDAALCALGAEVAAGAGAAVEQVVTLATTVTFAPHEECGMFAGSQEDDSTFLERLDDDYVPPGCKSHYVSGVATASAVLATIELAGCARGRVASGELSTEIRSGDREGDEFHGRASAIRDLAAVRAQGIAQQLYPVGLEPQPAGGGPRDPSRLDVAGDTGALAPGVRYLVRGMRDGRRTAVGHVRVAARDGARTTLATDPSPLAPAIGDEVLLETHVHEWKLLPVVTAGILVPAAGPGDPIPGPWSRPLGGASGSAVVTDVEVTQPAREVIATGYFTGTISLGPDSYTATAPAGGTDLFVVRYTATGDVLWSRHVAATGSVRGTNVDSARGDVYVTAEVQGDVDFGGGVLAAAGASDVALFKLGAAGDHQWSRRMGRASAVGGTSLAVSDDGFVYLSFVDPLGGSSLRHYDGDGALVWEQGGAYYQVATDEADRLYTLGADHVLAQRTSAGVVIAARPVAEAITGTVETQAFGVGPGPEPVVWVAGRFTDVARLADGGLWAVASGREGFAERLVPSATGFVATTVRVFGGPGVETVTRLEVDDAGHAAMVGYTTDMWTGIYPLPHVAGEDGFLIILDDIAFPFGKSLYGGAGDQRVLGVGNFGSDLTLDRAIGGSNTRHHRPADRELHRPDRHRLRRARAVRARRRQLTPRSRVRAFAVTVGPRLDVRELEGFEEPDVGPSALGRSAAELLGDAEPPGVIEAACARASDPPPLAMPHRGRSRRRRTPRRTVPTPSAGVAEHGGRQERAQHHAGGRRCAVEDRDTALLEGDGLAVARLAGGEHRDELAEPRLVADDGDADGAGARDRGQQLGPRRGGQVRRDRRRSPAGGDAGQHRGGLAGAPPRAGEDDVDLDVERAQAADDPAEATAASVGEGAVGVLDVGGALDRDRVADDHQLHRPSIAPIAPDASAPGRRRAPWRGATLTARRSPGTTHA